MGLDVGDRRIGIALSDETRTLASGLVTYERVGPRKDLKALGALAREHQVAELVVGLPRRLDGSIGPQAEKVLAFAAALGQATRLPVATWDERLTSVAAAEALAEAGHRGRARKARLDRAAATLILQEYLDARRRADRGSAA
jgi:putative Holliday junction resolvase